jgi:hypothetical protein
MTRLDRPQPSIPAPTTGDVLTYEIRLIALGLASAGLDWPAAMAQARVPSGWRWAEARAQWYAQLAGAPLGQEGDEGTPSTPVGAEGNPGLPFDQFVAVLATRSGYAIVK